MEYASYNFKIETEDRYGDANEVCVKAKNYAEAEKLAKSLIKGSGLKLGKLQRVVDCRLTVTQQDIVERKLIVEERHSEMSVKHSGEITEIKLDATKR